MNKRAFLEEFVGGGGGRVISMESHKLRWAKSPIANR